MTGDAVNVAARLEQAAPPGEILIGATTLSLVRDAVTVEPVDPLELKGKREPVPAFRLVRVDATADAFTRHLDAPLVGRVREQQRLRAAFEDVVSERVCHMFTLLGPAGVGKSRLTEEFLAPPARAPTSSAAAASTTARTSPTGRSSRSCSRSASSPAT